MTADPDSNDHRELVALARGIVERPLGSRAGFGALRKSDSILSRTVELIVESSFFSPPRTGAWPIGADPEYWHFHLRHFPGNHVAFFRDVLSTPRSYDPPCIWALFWALAKAEHEFLFRFLPFWSNEERLTGHLISQVVERFVEFSSPWRALAVEKDGANSQLNFWYADTATSRREKETGADVGFVIHAKFRNRDEFLKVIRLQAKKVGPSGSADIEFGQVQALLAKEKLGYYLFYHASDRDTWRLPPTICSAERFRDALKKHSEKGHPGRGPDKERIAVRNDGFDFASFLTFALADPSADHGRIVPSPSEAVHTLMGGDYPGGPPSRVMVITMGSEVPPTDWPHLFGEYIGGPTDNE